MDRAEVLALALYRSSLCPGGCGHPIDETTSHEDKGPQYDAKSTTCRACAELAVSQRAAAENNPDSPAQLWQVVKLKG